MRPTKRLRQGNTIYISVLYWNAEQRYFYSNVHKCLIPGNIRRKGCNVFLRYESYDEVAPGLPALQGAIAKNPKIDLQFVSGFKHFHFTKNSALKFMRHHTESMNQMYRDLLSSRNITY